MMNDIIYNNRDALLEIASKYERESIRDLKQLDMRTYIEALDASEWISISTALPSKGDVVGVKYKAGFCTSDEVIAKDIYSLNGERTEILAWRYAKNSEVIAWVKLPGIFDDIPNPVALIVEEYDKQQNSQIKPDSAKPFTHIYDYYDEEKEGETDSPRSVIEAIEDAANEMNYSNYHNSKFDTAIRIIKKYCVDNKIPPNYTKDTK